ncbi:MAG: hypothetical protein MZV64_21855 [Ignavibacteriales bacterium]|nr:hypothetical protein [Ignavibacteriales bacterium]
MNISLKIKDLCLKGMQAELHGMINLMLRIAQDFGTGIGSFQIALDILNVLNLVNNEWGWFQTTSQDTYNIVTLNGTDPATGKPVYRFSKPSTNTAWTPTDLLSRWQMQLGLRYTF